MVSIPFASLVRWSLDRRAPGRQRDLSRQECQLWRFCWWPTSVPGVSRRLTVFRGWRGYVGWMDGLMKKSCVFGAEMKIRHEW
jgi:hypothetical protein